MLIVETGPVTDRLRVREIDDDEGPRLVRIIRRGSGSVVTWRGAQMVLLSAQGMDVPAIAKVAFTSEDRVRDVIRNFNADGFGSLCRNTRAAPRPSFSPHAGSHGGFWTYLGCTRYPTKVSPGLQGPQNVGPSRIPARISPSTGGCPSRLAAAPRSLARMMMIATSARSSWTSLRLILGPPQAASLNGDDVTLGSMS